MRLFVSLCSALLLAGCSSWEPDPDQITPVPKDRLLGMQAPVPNGGEVVVTRQYALMGGGCYVAVLIDREVVARIHVAEQARFQVPAGQHVVGIATDKADDTLCGMSRLNTEEAATVRPGEASYFDIIVDSNIGFDIEPGEAP